MHPSPCVAFSSCERVWTNARIATQGLGLALVAMAVGLIPGFGAPEGLKGGIIGIGGATAGFIHWIRQPLDSIGHPTLVRSPRTREKALAGWRCGFSRENEGGETE